MRTASTIARTADGWILVSGPDVPADKQRQKFNDIKQNWPKEWLEVRFQLSDRPGKRKLSGESETDLIKKAEKHVADKLANLKSREEARELEVKKKAEAEAKAAAEENARVIAAKEETKKKLFAQHLAAKEAANPKPAQPRK